MLLGASVARHWRLVRGGSLLLLLGVGRLRGVALLRGGSVLLVEVINHVELLLGWQLLGRAVFTREAVVNDEGRLVHIQVVSRR